MHSGFGEALSAGTAGMLVLFHQAKLVPLTLARLGLINKQYRLKVMAIAPILEYLKMDV